MVDETADKSGITSFAHFVGLIVRDCCNEQIGVGHEMQKLFEVDLAVPVVIQAHHDLDQVVAVHVNFDVGQRFLGLKKWNF